MNMSSDNNDGVLVVDIDGTLCGIRTPEQSYGELEPRHDVVDELLVGRRSSFEDHHRRDVHVRVRVVLQVQEGRVERCQAVRIRHAARLSPIGALGVNAASQSPGQVASASPRVAASI